MYHRTSAKVLWSRSLWISPSFNSSHKSQFRGIVTLENKQRLTHVLITGGSQGIGLAIAHSFAKAQSYKVTILGRDVSRLKTACEDLHQYVPSNERNIDAIAADITQPSIWTNKTISTVKNDTDPFKSGIDILINAAGITHSSLLSAMSVGGQENEHGEVENIMNTNLMGTIYACRAVSKIMIRNKSRNPSPVHSPCIINISSLLGIMGGRGASVYAASKAGVLGELVMIHFRRSEASDTFQRLNTSTGCRTWAIRNKSKRNRTGLRRNSHDKR
jgi:NAD(P)-dependent dehydrogenase (short-subunit alcohol dehydrogenase family)